MTSASKLFHTRRIRFDPHSNTVDNTESGSSYRRTTTNRRLNDRQDLGGCNPPPRRIHRHRLSEQGVNESPSGSGSIINSEDFRSIRRWGTNGNDRLPGVVLLARERLVERLRGAHVRESSMSSSSSNHEDEVVEEAVRMVPPGLSEDALNQLPIEVFEKVKVEERSKECSICLEGFEDGDEVINLTCMHSFHSYCLFPWVEVCGACPNCRKIVVVSSSKLVSSP